MVEAVLNIKKWGSSLGVRLPAAVAREARLHVDQSVRLSVDGDQVLITPVENSRPSLEQRLSTYDLKRHGGEQLSTRQKLGVEAS